MSNTYTTDNNNTPNTPNTPPNKDADITSVYMSIFNRSNVVILLWFLAIYYIIYLILGIFSSSQQNNELIASRMFDFIVFAFILVILIYNYMSSSQNDLQTSLSKSGSSVVNYMENPDSIFSTLLFIFVLYTTIYVIGIPMGVDSKPFVIKLLEGGAWIVFAILLIENVFKYAFGVNFMGLLTNWASPVWSTMPSTATIDTSMNNVEKQKEEVFNIKNNNYDYKEAQAICKSYGARMATYDDIEKTYNKGGEWCNYGWSDNQMIFFPTQKATWDKLQQDPKTKNNCGRPGINGGFIDNPYMKFGVNCYGIKPKPSDEDLLSMQTDAVQPTTPAESELDDKVRFWKENGSKILHLNAFNPQQWSQY